MPRRSSATRRAEPSEAPTKPKPPTHYRIVTFRRPRTPWRPSRDEALEDAKRLGLASYDPSRREHYLAVPVAIDTFTGFKPPAD
ncbi:hypothetical protein [Sphingomonas montanisoli]|uniref:Uncharacterized protein n=1 Tax=Sphingomonas montanisoli TaxID=2606412 RepID=A0A5D9C8E6_9SPHN|nr:hypothetical protein [Sphingomonas montanisoli]TZG28064.1 hypothetical protein FYJ91_11105 [Sphingomonas montanisoli]